MDDLGETLATLVDPSSLEVLIASSLAAYQSMVDFQRYGVNEYLKASFHHQVDVLRNLGRQAGRLQLVERNWSDKFQEQYNTRLRRFALRPEVSRHHHQIRMVLGPKDFEQTIDLVDRYVGLVEKGTPPQILLRKLGIISVGVIGIAQECRREIEQRRGFARLTAMPNPMREFSREFALYSGPPFEPKVMEGWQRPYLKKEEAVNWEEGDLSDVLEKIDFNLKKIAKGIAIACGIAVCTASTCGKIASIVIVNPVLNAISLQGLLAGAGIAVAPESAAKLLNALGGGANGGK